MIVIFCWDSFSSLLLLVGSATLACHTVTYPARFSALRLMLLHDTEKGNLANLDAATVEGSPSFPHKLSPYSNFYGLHRQEFHMYRRALADGDHEMVHDQIPVFHFPSLIGTVYMPPITLPHKAPVVPVTGSWGMRLTECIRQAVHAPLELPTQHRQGETCTMPCVNESGGSQ